MQIDKNIPIPTRRRNASDYPFKNMVVGDSVFYPGAFKNVHDCKAYEYAKTMQRRNEAFRFTARILTENDQRGVRIWRID